LASNGTEGASSRIWKLAASAGSSIALRCDRLALRSDSDGDACALGRPGEMVVDPGGLLGAAGHARDQQRRSEPTAEELDR
jgi:hypothetical protein